MSLMFLHASVEMYEELGHFSLWTRELSDSYFHRTAKGFYVLSSILFEETRSICKTRQV